VLLIVSATGTRRSASAGAMRRGMSAADWAAALTAAPRIT
jgi:hypothetical protein